jgi:hypothetical protein
MPTPVSPSAAVAFAAQPGLFLCWKAGDGAHANLEIRRADGTREVMGLNVERPANRPRIAPPDPKHPGRPTIVLKDRVIPNAKELYIGPLTANAEEALRREELGASWLARERHIVYGSSASARMPSDAEYNCVGYVAALIEAATGQPMPGLRQGDIGDLVEAARMVSVVMQRTTGSAL